MQTLFDAPSRSAILDRLTALQPASTRRWGKMDPAQMLTHCRLALEGATGDTPKKQKLLGRLLAPLVKGSVLGEKPFARNAPTDPSFVVADARDFAAERELLKERVEKFVRQGPAEAGKYPHVFFGKLSGEEWGVLMWKHLDHHLRQFGA